MIADEARGQVFLRRWGIWLILLAAVGLLGYFLVTALRFTGGEWGVPLDDAWIHFQFARNLSSGNGFSYIPGKPTPGSTAPLWTVLIAPIGLFTEQFVIFTLLISAVFMLVAVYLVYRLALTLTDDDYWVALLAAAATALSGRMLWAGLSAMEITAFTSFSLWALWLYHRNGLTGWAALLFALAGQLRPEGHLLFALVGIDAIASVWRPQNSAERQTTLRNLIVAVVIYALVALPYTLFSLSVTGKPLPNTFYAKARGDEFYSFSTLLKTLTLHWRDNIVAALLALIGLIPLWRRSRVIVVWLVVLLLAYPALVSLVWHHGRYTMPLIPLQMLAAAFGARWLITQLPAKRRLLGWSLVALLIVGAGVLRLSYWSGMLGYNNREIIDIDVRMGQWLADNTAADDVIAVDDIGAIVYLAQRDIVDLNGLVSPEMWPIMGDEAFNPAAIHLMYRAGVDYLAVFPSWHGPIIAAPNLATPVALFETGSHTIIGNPEAGIYTTQWPYVTEANPQIARDVVLGDAVRFMGYDWDDSAENPTLTVYWESLQALDSPLYVFLHLVDAQGNIVAQIDRQPNDGITPTQFWQPGDIIPDTYTIIVPDDAPDGQYAIRLGIYSQATMQRLPITAGGSGDTIDVIRISAEITTSLPRY